MMAQSAQKSNIEIILCVYSSTYLGYITLTYPPPPRFPNMYPIKPPVAIPVQKPPPPPPVPLRLAPPHEASSYPPVPINILIECLKNRHNEISY